MTEGRYILVNGEKVLWEGNTVKGANLREKGTDFKAIWISVILIVVSLAAVAATGVFVFGYVAFFCIFVIIGNMSYQCGKFVITDKRILWGRKKTGMMYYTDITRKCHLTCYKSGRNVGFVKLVRDVNYSKQKHKTVYIRGVADPERVCSILQSVIDSK